MTTNLNTQSITTIEHDGEDYENRLRGIRNSCPANRDRNNSSVQFGISESASLQRLNQRLSYAERQEQRYRELILANRSTSESPIAIPTNVMMRLAEKTEGVLQIIKNCE